MSVNVINKSVKIIDEDILQITVKFAENNLSKTCLKLADDKNDKYYEWTLEAGAYMVMFELPKLFGVEFLQISNMLGFYCIDYIREMKLNNDNLLSTYIKNFDKKIKF